MNKTITVIRPISDPGVDMERACRVGVSRINGVGAVTFGKWLTLFGSMRRLWEMKEEEMWERGQREVPFPDREVKLLQYLLALRNRVDPEAEIKRLTDQGIRTLCLGIDETYPGGIAALTQPPPVLYVRGELQEADSHGVAVVGTRRPTGYGMTVTEQFVSMLVADGFTIISGLAFGIDSIAHRTALRAGGRTIGFLASGVDLITPTEHEQLGRDIIKNGALISAFAPGDPARKGNFVARNQLIVGMSLGVLVPEGGIKSGTRLTAEFALHQQKPVFAVPGQITSIMSQGPLNLVGQGAILTTSASQISKLLSKNPQVSRSRKMIQDISPVQQKIERLLARNSFTVDEIIRETQCTAAEIMSALMMMELEGWVQKTGEKWTGTHQISCEL